MPVAGHRLTKPVLFSIILLSFAGCEETSNQEIGTIVGAVVGNALSDSVKGSGIGAQIARLGLTFGGAMIGSEIGKSLDKQDRARMESAAQKALSSGRTQSWTNPQTGVSGKATVVAQAGKCRTVRQSVTLKDGLKKSENVKACLEGETWERA